MTIMIIFTMFLYGCGEENKVRTAPWTQQEIEQMEDSNVDSVPVFVWSF